MGGLVTTRSLLSNVSVLPLTAPFLIFIFCVKLFCSCHSHGRKGRFCVWACVECLGPPRECLCRQVSHLICCVTFLGFTNELLSLALFRDDNEGAVSQVDLDVMDVLFTGLVDYLRLENAYNIFILNPKRPNKVPKYGYRCVLFLFSMSFFCCLHLLTDSEWCAEEVCRNQKLNFSNRHVFLISSLCLLLHV